ncbi:hypothetical protein OAV81_02855 [Candidatus Thioglobus sp.]|nr:hypothetical protein [Candidatus Thioglobus sp.]
MNEFCSDNFFAQKRRFFFDDDAISFLHSLSKKIMAHSEARQHPELLALAFWLRKSNLLMIFKKWIDRQPTNQIITSRGIAFHIAPSNVDSIFVYSWALSMIAGNINVVRVSLNQGKQLNTLFYLIGEHIRKYPELEQRNRILTYTHDNEISSFLSLKADLRIIWGGDKTVETIRDLPTKPNTKDVTFTDKSSLSLINAHAYMELSDKQSLAHLFYNDSYWFDQKACSSPSRVIFVGERVICKEASKNFWGAMRTELKRHKQQDDQSLAIQKLSYVYQLIIDNSQLEPVYHSDVSSPTVLRHIEGEAVKPQCGGGFFIESFVVSLDQVQDQTMVKDQTIAYYGFEQDDLMQLALTFDGRKVDRIVPLGSALDFSPVWDGYDLISEFSKRLIVM